MTQFGIAHVAILCAAALTISYIFNIFPVLVACASVVVLLFFAFAKR